MMRRLPPALLLGAVLSAGCEPGQGAGDGAPAFELRDSAGVVVAYSREPVWSDSAALRVARDAELIVSTPEEASPRYILYEVGDIERLSDGRILVENTGTQEILVFGEDGSFLEAWGGKGEGPNEFLNLRGMHVCGDDHIVQFEWHRVTEFSPEGQVIRREDLPLDSIRLGSSTVLPIGVSADCRSVLTAAVDREWLPNSSTVGFASLIAEVSWTHGPDAPVERVRKIPYVEYFKVDPQARSNIEFSAFTYAASLETQGGFVYVGVGDQAQVEVLGPTGDPVRVIRWDVADTLVTEADWDAYSRDRAAYIEDNPSWAASRYPARRDHVERTRKPVFATNDVSTRPDPALRVDDRGALWVRQYQRSALSERPEFDPPQRWWVFDAEGMWLGEVVLPEDFRLRSVRAGHILGVSVDRLGVESVRAYRILGSVEQPE